MTPTISPPDPKSTHVGSTKTSSTFRFTAVGVILGISMLAAVSAFAFLVYRVLAWFLE